MGNLSLQIHLLRRSIRIISSSTDLSAQNYQHNLFFLAESEFGVCLTWEDLFFPAPVVFSREAGYPVQPSNAAIRAQSEGMSHKNGIQMICIEILILLCGLKQIVSSFAL